MSVDKGSLESQKRYINRLKTEEAIAKALTAEMLKDHEAALEMAAIAEEELHGYVMDGGKLASGHSDSTNPDSALPASDR